MTISEDYKAGYEEGVKTALKGIIECILEETDKEGVKFIKQVINDYE